MSRRPTNSEQDGYSRAIAGESSGGICAFAAAWFMPDKFARVHSGGRELYVNPVAVERECGWRQCVPIYGAQGSEAEYPDVDERWRRTIWRITTDRGPCRISRWQTRWKFRELRFPLPVRHGGCMAALRLALDLPESADVALGGITIAKKTSQDFKKKWIRRRRTSRSFG